MNEKLRLFIALKLNKEIQTAIHQIQKDFLPLNLDIKWVEAANLHLTLSFLGTTSTDQISGIKTLLKEVAQTLTSTECHLSKLGAFPSLKKPRIFFVSLSDSAGVIADTAQSLKEKFTSPGFPKEQHTFLPHITLGRFRSAKNINIFHEKSQTYSLPQETIAFNNLTLFKSTLTSAGPIYEIIEQLPFERTPLT